jgi:O-antigen ligase
MTKVKHDPVAPAAPAPPRDWPSRLRRGLVILVTALVVARPLVLGEDPGLLDPISDAGGLVLTLLWLTAAVGWAGWRLWSGQGVWYGGLVEAGLLAVAGCALLSSGLVASYRHPAWLVSCEWLVLLVCLSLVRQLASTADTRRGLLTAVVATGVALAAYGVYQGAFELPRQRSIYRNREELRRDWERQTGRPISPDDPELEDLAQRIQQNNAFGTFVNPNSFASYLALLLPAAVGYAAVAWRRRDSTWQPVLTLVAAGLVAAALALTASRGAGLATLLVAVGLGLWFGRHFLRRHLPWAAVGLAVLVVTAVLLARAPADGTVKRLPAQSLAVRLNYWKAAWAMIRDHPWLGVGPGSFSRYYPRYMLPAAVNEKISDPHNFTLEVWANAGVFATAALFVALGALAWRLVQAARHPGAVPRDPPPRPESDPPWDFYLGGMAGLLLGFVLKASAAPSPDYIIVWGAEAAGRSVVWFAAFALFWSTPWSGPSVLVALAAGLLACLLNLGVSGGIMFPSVAQPFWVVAALALALATAAAPGWRLRPGLPLFLPLPALGAAALAYFLLLLLPATGCDYHLRQARLRQDQFREMAASRDPKVRSAARQPKSMATSHLKEARKADPASVAPLVALARWHLEVDPPGGTGGTEEALKDLRQARALDPLGKEVRVLTFAVLCRQHQLDAAAQALKDVLEIDPSEACRLHALLAETRFAARDDKAAYREAVLAWQEDAEARQRGWPAYQLTEAQRRRVRGWVDGMWSARVGPALASAPQGPLHLLPALYLNAEPPSRRPPAPRTR